LKKRIQNGKRRGNKGKGPCLEEAQADDGLWKPEIVAHVRIVVSLIEGRRVEVAEIEAMLLRRVRQRRLFGGTRKDYGVGRTHNQDDPGG
jgi:hypothetical protein